MAGQEAGSDKQCHVFYAYTVRGEGEATPVQPVLIDGLIDCKQNVREASHLEAGGTTASAVACLEGVGGRPEGGGKTSMMNIVQLDRRITQPP